jgi:hypothetical protein
LYYVQNQLRANPAKTQVCSFHLKNAQAGRQLKIAWNGVTLEHSDCPKYLGVTLDRSLTYAKHCQDTGKKVSARNGIIRQLVTSKWGAQPNVLRSSAMALCISAAEYCCPVWGGSVHAKKVDVSLNETMRIITGCLKPTKTEYLYQLAGIAPPEVRRSVASDRERQRVQYDCRHPMHLHSPVPARLKSRNSFAKRTVALDEGVENARIERWWDSCTDQLLPPSECLAPGACHGWPVWRTINRARTGCARTLTNLHRWGYEGDSRCACGETQDLDHCFSCPLLGNWVTQQDLVMANDLAVQWAKENLHL